jgi:hypothetical protein
VKRAHFVAVLVLAGATALSANAAVSMRPSLRVVKIDPAVRVAGTHFRARERVHVKLTTTDSARLSRWVQASGRGAFTARIGPLPEGFDRCSDGFTVLARGRSGDRATVKRIPPGCPPPDDD